MKRVVLFSLFVFVLTALPSSAIAQDQDTGSAPPIRSDIQEREKVRLVLVETLVIGPKNVTIADMKQEEFELIVGGEPRKIDTFDVLCPAGAMPDPGALKKGDPYPSPIAPQDKRKIVFVFDYYSMQIPNRPRVLDAAQWMVDVSKTPEEEIMVVAMADGLRIEQRFTKDKQEIFEAFNRMEHDSSLWAREFGLGATGKSYFDDMSGLLEVLEAYDGQKIIVLFSELQGNPRTQDNWFMDVSVRSTLSRTAIYPNWAAGVTIGNSVVASGILSRFATESGGRPQVYTNDLSVQYRRAQRDLSCRYALGFYLTADEADRHRRIRVHSNRENTRPRFPENIKLFTDDEKRKMRERAAFIDPQAHENPLVRAYAQPMRPDGGQWQTLLALHFPMPVGTEGATVNLNAHLRRGARRTADVSTPIEIPALKSGMPGTQSVTVIGDRTLKPGKYDFTVILSQEGNKEVVSAKIPIRVPEVPSEGVFVQGPVLARLVKEGVLIRGGKDEEQEETELDKMLGEGESIEPLMVYAIKEDDKFLSYWEACFAGKKNQPKGAKVHRRFYGEGGAVTYEMDPIPFAPPAGKGKVFCQSKLEEVPGGTLPPGEYTLQVAVESAKGELITQSDVPLDVNE